MLRKEPKVTAEVLETTAKLACIARLEYQRLGGRTSTPSRVRFYPYRRLHHTIRLRSSGIAIRISDILEEAPRQVLEALVVILVGKLLGSPTAPRSVRLYRDHINSVEVRHLSAEIRRTRGRKILSGPDGRWKNLDRIYDRLNAEYFQGGLAITRIGWSQKSHRRVLGHYDPAHRVIVINRRLDSLRVPNYVVEYVVYHEMLHAALGEEFRDGRRWVHHRRFRMAERKFPAFEKASSFIRTCLC